MILLHTFIAFLPATLGMVVKRDTELQRPELHSWLETAQKGDVMHRGNTVYEVIQAHDAALAKRQGTGSCPNAQYEKREVLKTWLEWGDPTPLPGGCMDCFKNEAPCHYTQSAGWSISQTVSIGMDFGLAAKFAEDITANAGFSMGFTWTKGWDGTTSFTCDVPAGKGDRILVQPRIGVADVRSRLCRSSCINESCQPWTNYQARYPLKDSHGIAVQPPQCVTVNTWDECMKGL